VSIDFAPIGTAGLERFQELRGAAIDAVTERFYASYADDYAEFGQGGRDPRSTLATAIAQSVMTFGLLQMEIPASSGRRVLLACVAGNNHAVGLQMVSDAFQMAGWQVQYLGANVPSSALIAQVRLFKPALLGLSVSFAQQLRVVKDLMSRLKESLGTERPAVIVGGMAINQFNRLAGEFGADGWSPNAAEAVTLAAKLAA
jgi:methanogenic corrinoid protein MtbC1